jgi:hypothetical protein
MVGRVAIVFGTFLPGVLGCSDPEAAGGPQSATLVDAGKDAAGGAAGAGPVPDAAPFDGPLDLAETGLYSDLAARALAPGVIAFEVRYELWSDGAEKARFLLLPEGSRIDTSKMDWWRFPVGTKAWKEFTVDGKTIETRMLHKQREPIDEEDTGWQMVSYLWDEAGTRATAVPEGVEDALGTSYDVPSQEDCHKCHDGAGDVLIGPSAILLSAADGNGMLSKLAADGRLSDPPPAEFSPPGEGVVQDALGYLHASCGNCHNSVSGLSFIRSLRLRLRVSDQTPEETLTYSTAIGGRMNHDILGSLVAVVPGKPRESQIYVRMSFRDREDFMPPAGTEIVHAEGLATIEQWILGLAP